MPYLNLNNFPISQLYLLHVHTYAVELREFARLNLSKKIKNIYYTKKTKSVVDNIVNGA